jgi:hypothetical protein
MKKSNSIAWVILILFSILLGYMGTRAFHFSSPIAFVIIVISASMIVILSFSRLKDVE